MTAHPLADDTFCPANVTEGHTFVETREQVRNERIEQDVTCTGCQYVSTGWYQS